MEQIEECLQQSHRNKNEGIKSTGYALVHVSHSSQNKEPVGDDDTIPQDLIDKLDSLTNDELKVGEHTHAYAHTAKCLAT